MRHIILGTAGHIDHGKSALVKALTGTDPDRLKEERERGITIDIGFAELSYPESGLTVGIVDVPGHEKLVRNMLAGAGGIDIVLLVIAADEGVMPQSREHLAICNLLRIKSGLIAITKSDLVEKDWLSLVADDVRDFVRGTFLEGAPIIPVSSKTGHNLELLKEAVRDKAHSVTPKSAGGIFRLPIDRVFSLRGFGTVVTGTAVSGTVGLDDPLEILPSHITTRVRGLHSHGASISSAVAGQRVAINLQGVEKEDIKRGDVAVLPDVFHETRTVDAFLELLADTPVLKTRSLVHLYCGTMETVARLVLYEQDEVGPGLTCYCQFRLHDPGVMMSGDRFIIRRFSPLETLGGGEVLDPFPRKRKRRDGIADLKKIYTGTIEEKLSAKIESAGRRGVSLSSLRGWITTDTDTLTAAVRLLQQRHEVVQCEDLLLSRQRFELLQREIRDMLDNFHKKNPLKSGISKEEARNQLQIDAKLFNYALSKTEGVTVEKDILRLSGFKVALSSSEEEYQDKIVAELKKGRFQPPLKEDLASALKIPPARLTDILGVLTREGKLIRISDTFYLLSGVYTELTELLRRFFSTKSEMTVAEFRDLLNTSRKYALPLLEYLDSHKVTIRTGDVRKLLTKR